MSKFDTVNAIAKLKPRLMKRAIDMRESGASNAEIARFLTTETGLVVGRENVRTAFLRMENEAKNEATSQD